MFKWFAPLLLFAGKPDVVIRIVTLAIAGAVLFFGVWLISNVALTLDALKNPYNRRDLRHCPVLLFCRGRHDCVAAPAANGVSATPRSATAGGRVAAADD